MFDLEAKIAVWRVQLNRAGLQASEIVDELETHLRDELERQVYLGLSDEQAFSAAVATIGNPKKLKREFSRSLTIKEARRGKETAIIHLVVAGIYELVGFSALSMVCFESNVTPNVRAQSLGCFAAAHLIWIALWRLRQIRFPVLNKPTQLAGSLLSLIWLYVGGVEFIARNPYASGSIWQSGWWAFAPGLVWSLGTFIELENSPVDEGIASAA